LLARGLSKGLLGTSGTVSRGGVSSCPKGAMGAAGGGKTAPGVAGGTEGTTGGGDSWAIVAPPHTTTTAPIAGFKRLQFQNDMTLSLNLIRGQFISKYHPHDRSP
jgi:hypothetical protein